MLPARVVGRDARHVLLETAEFGQTAIPLARAAALGTMMSTGDKAQLMIRAEKLTLGPAGGDAPQAVIRKCRLPRPARPLFPAHRRRLSFRR